MNQQEHVPSLTPFAWDVTTAVFLGTGVVAILDDLRGWGTHWAVLQGRTPTLRKACKALINETREYIALRRDPFEPEDAASSLASWFGTISEHESEANRDPSQPHVCTWEDFETFLEAEEKFAPTPDRAGLASSSSIEPVNAAVRHLLSELDALSHPAATAASMSMVGHLRASLLDFPVRLEEFRGWLSDLAQASTPLDPERPTAGKVARMASGPRLTMTFVDLLLEVVGKELKTGWGHAYRG